MGRNQVAVPADRAPLDRYGSMTQGFLKRVMLDLRIDYSGAGATRVASGSKRRKRRAKPNQFFMPGGRSDLFPGVWFSGRTEREFYPVILFVRMTSYSERLKLNEIVTDLVRQKKDRTFRRAFRKTFRQR